MLKTACLLEWTQKNIEDLIRGYPAVQSYYEFVAKEIGCEIKDLVWLGVQDHAIEQDEDGWGLKSFFPKEAKLSIKLLNDNYTVEGFILGYIKRIEYNGKVFISECCASPWMVYADSKKFKWTDESEGVDDEHEG